MNGSTTLETKQMRFLADSIYRNNSPGWLLEFLEYVGYRFELRCLPLVKKLGVKITYGSLYRVNDAALRSDASSWGRTWSAKRLKWAGHMARMNEDHCCKKIFLPKPMGNRPEGRPPLRWIDCVEKDLNI
ncbi:hypothetical protein TNCV_193121 [Trichonephila clavipes]|nr:hypothetical protein TNCV_193121 [Trichonephila clavipes]